MADVTGPTNKLPGDQCHLPKGAMCDYHPDVLAVARVQGETDSFGSENEDLCQACVDQAAVETAAYKLIPRCCDWCKKSSLSCAPARDYNEGSCGPVYDVCQMCRGKQQDDAQEELDSYQDQCDDDYDD